MRRSVRNPMKLLLHACCGPCSLEPTRILRAAGHDLTLYYANSNIAPAEEYAHRLGTLRTWAGGEGLPVVEGPYDPAAWEATAGRVGEAALAAADGDVLRTATHPALREARCRACYRLRFEEAARVASERRFDAVGTTLSVSPYQFTEVIREELERAAAAAGVRALFEDYRPFYDEATRRSRATGMYRPSARPRPPRMPTSAPPRKPPAPPSEPNERPTPRSRPASAPPCARCASRGAASGSPAFGQSASQALPSRAKAWACFPRF